MDNPILSPLMHQPYAWIHNEVVQIHFLSCFSMWLFSHRLQLIYLHIKIQFQRINFLFATFFFRSLLKYVWSNSFIYFPPQVYAAHLFACVWKNGNIGCLSSLSLKGITSIFCGTCIASRTRYVISQPAAVVLYGLIPCNPDIQWFSWLFFIWESVVMRIDFCPVAFQNLFPFQCVMVSNNSRGLWRKLSCKVVPFIRRWIQVENWTNTKHEQKIVVWK